MTNYHKIVQKLQSALHEIKDDNTFSSQIKLSIKKTINICNQALKNNKRKSQSEIFADEAKKRQKIWWDSIIKGLTEMPKSDTNNEN